VLFLFGVVFASTLYGTKRPVAFLRGLCRHTPKGPSPEEAEAECKDEGGAGADTEAGLSGRVVATLPRPPKVPPLPQVEFEHSQHRIAELLEGQAAQAEGDRAREERIHLLEARLAGLEEMVGLHQGAALGEMSQLGGGSEDVPS
jgi:hypothetical protein